MNLLLLRVKGNQQNINYLCKQEQKMHGLQSVGLRMMVIETLSTHFTHEMHGPRHLQNAFMKPSKFKPGKLQK